LYFVIIAQTVLLLLLAKPVSTSEESSGEAGYDGTAEDSSDEAEYDGTAEEEREVRKVPTVPGIFHFDESNKGYAELGGESESYSDSQTSVVKKWYSRSSSRYSDTMTLGMWIKPEKNSADSSSILKFELIDYYDLQVVKDRLQLLVIEPSGYYYIYTFPHQNFALNEWHFILLTVNDRGLMRPDLYIKGLKAPLKRLLRKTSEQGALDADSMKSSKNVILGEGFTGKITPVLIGSYYSASKLLSYQECLAYSDQYSPECRRYIYNIMPGSHLLATYKLSSNSNIKLEPYTEIRVSSNTTFQCKDSGVSLTIGPAAFDLPKPILRTARHYDRRNYGEEGEDRGYYRTRYFKYTDYPVNITLGELKSGCNLTWSPGEGYEDEAFEITNTDLASCGFRSRREGEQIVYWNSVYSHSHTESKKLMDVSCKYTPRPEKKEELRVSAYVVDVMSMETTHTFTPWTLSLHLFSDSSFSNSKELDLPIHLGSNGENIYVEARVKTGVKGAGATLLIKSCRTHITLNELDEMQRTLIKNFEVVSSSVELLNSDDSARKRFMLKGDKFEDYPNAMVYLSCELIAKELNM